MSHIGEIAVVDDGTVTSPEERRSRRETNRTMSEESNVVLETGKAGPTPEDALADAQKALEQKDRDLEAERARSTQAVNDAATARDQAARERQARQGDRKSAVTNAVEAAKADRSAAQAEIKAAREAGDLDAEFKANDKLSSANYRLNSAQDALTQIEAGGTHAAPEGGEERRQGGNAVSPAAQNWIDRHPKFSSDANYRRIALAAHGQALMDGASADSPAYFRYLDEAVAKIESGNQRGENDMNDRSGRRESSDGAPPSRGNGGHGGASKMIKTPLGALNVTRRTDGKLAIQIPPALRDTFEEGARISNMTLADYAYEQVKIADEIAQGGNAGLITEEGQSWR